jgi:hypothetical protein
MSGLAWDVMFELGTSTATFTHAVPLVPHHDLRELCAIVQPPAVGVSLAPGVRSDGYVLGCSIALRDDEESIALLHYILYL